MADKPWDLPDWNAEIDKAVKRSISPEKARWSSENQSVEAFRISRLEAELEEMKAVNLELAERTKKTKGNFDKQIETASKTFSIDQKAQVLKFIAAPAVVFSGLAGLAIWIVLQGAAMETARSVAEEVAGPLAGKVAKDVAETTARQEASEVARQAAIDPATAAARAIAQKMVSEAETTVRRIAKEEARDVGRSAAKEVATVAGERAARETAERVAKFEAGIAATQTAERVAREVAATAARNIAFEDIVERLSADADFVSDVAAASESTFNEAVVAFASESGCPTGWSEYRQAWGRFIVGVATDAQLANAVPGFGEDEQGERLEARTYGRPGGAQNHSLSIGEISNHGHFATVVVPGNDGHNATAFPPGSNNLNIRDVIEVINTQDSIGKARSEPHNNMPPYVALHFCKKGDA